MEAEIMIVVEWEHRAVCMDIAVPKVMPSDLLPDAKSPLYVSH